MGVAAGVQARPTPAATHGNHLCSTWLVFQVTSNGFSRSWPFHFYNQSEIVHALSLATLALFRVWTFQRKPHAAVCYFNIGGFFSQVVFSTEFGAASPQLDFLLKKIACSRYSHKSSEGAAWPTEYGKAMYLCSHTWHFPFLLSPIALYDLCSWKVIRDMPFFH